ncbi:MAG: hypothetical protein U1E76_23930 [Planctomycetota bacterium]
MRSSALKLLLVLGLFQAPQPDAATMRARVELQLDQVKSVAFSYQTLPASKLGEKPPQVGPDEANWRLYAIAFGGELETRVRLKVGEQVLEPGKYGFYIQPRAEGGMRLMLLDGPKSRPIELELSRSSIEHRYLTLALAPTDLATFELTVAWGKDVGRARFWTP